MEINWISLLTIVATLITALATFLTVREIRKQRESSYQPDLFLLSKTLNVFFKSFGDKFLPLKISEKSEPQKPTDYHKLNINIHNLGFGVAKKVVYQWEFNIKEAVDLIKKYDNKKYFYFKIGSTLDIKSDKLNYRFGHVVSNQLREEKVNYVLPTAIDNNPTAIKFPIAYLDLFLLFTHTAYIEKENKTEVKETFPKLTLKIHYQDINKKKHTKQFQVLFNFWHFLAPNDRTKENDHFGQMKMEVEEL